MTSLTSEPFVFFTEDRSRFFRVVSGSRRELVAACLRAVYEHLHGPSASLSTNLTKNEFRELLYPVVLQYENTLKDDVIDELSQDADPSQMAGLVLKTLVRDGWLEQFADRQGLVTAFRFSRAGKTFAEALWTMDRPSRTRQRNMRSCRNSLAAVAQAQGDANDLLDAFEYAEKVIQDLNDTTDQLQARTRELMREASVHTQWQNFIEYLEQFQTSISKQLTVDSATLHRSTIVQSVEAIRERQGTPAYDRLRQQLKESAKWISAEAQGDDELAWLLNRIEELVCAAHDSRQPGFLKAMDTYIKRITGLVQQSMMLRTSTGRLALSSALTMLSTSDEEQRAALLESIGAELGLAQVRLLDPGVFRMRAAGTKKKATTVSVPPRATRDSRLEAALRNAASRAFQMPNALAVTSLEEHVARAGGTVRLSALPVATAKEVMLLLQGVEAVRGDPKKTLKAQRMDSELATPFFTGADYIISAQ